MRGRAVVFHAPCGKPRIPVGARQRPRAVAQHLAGEHEGLFAFSFEEIGGDDALHDPVVFIRPERSARIAAGKPCMRGLRLALAHHAAHLTVDFAEARRADIGFLVVDRIDRMGGLPPLTGRGTGGMRGRGRTLAQRELVNVGGAGMIVIGRHPVAQFRIARDVVRAHIFDMQHMADQAAVFQLRGQLVGFREAAALGGGENLAVEFAVGAGQDFRAPDARLRHGRCFGLGRGRKRRGEHQHGEPGRDSRMHKPSPPCCHGYAESPPDAHGAILAARPRPGKRRCRNGTGTGD